jgi:hypothetical protein
MDTNVMINILCQIHITNTKEVNSAFIFDSGIEATKINKIKFNKITKNDDSIDHFVELCMKKFNENFPKEKYGSVHCEPLFWTKTALATISKFLNSDDTTNKISFPNGCCSVKNCPINNFYMLVLNELIIK